MAYSGPDVSAYRQKPISEDEENDSNDDQGSYDQDHDLLKDLPASTPGLSSIEKKNLFMLFSLYFIHVVPLSFAWNTMPILLRQQLSYTKVGTFLVSQYPYSIKVLWSPIIEAVHWPSLGRRKTWIVPSFVIASTALLWLGLAQNRLILRIAGGETLAMTLLVLAWLLVMFMGSNIRIALDAWALELLSQPNVHWASPAVTVAETAAGFIAFNLFLGLSSVTDAKDSNAPPASTRFFYFFWAIAFVIVAFAVLIFRKEHDYATTKRTIRGSYAIIWKIVMLPQVWTLMLVHMTSMIGFMTNDSITVLQLVKNGFTDRDIAGLATVSFPFEVVCGIMISRTFATNHPLRIWRKMFPWRLLVAFISQLSILLISENRESHYRWLIALVPFCLSKFFETAMFVALVAFHAQVSDPQYGGIYLALLATTLNIRYDSMQFLFTKTIGILDGGEDLSKPSRLVDGYQIVNTVAVVSAIPVFWFFLRPATMYLQTVEPSAWRISSGDHDKVYEMVATHDTAHLDEE